MQSQWRRSGRLINEPWTESIHRSAQQGSGIANTFWRWAATSRSRDSLYRIPGEPVSWHQIPGFSAWPNILISQKPCQNYHYDAIDQQQKFKNVMISPNKNAVKSENRSAMMDNSAVQLASCLLVVICLPEIVSLPQWPQCQVNNGDPTIMVSSPLIEFGPQCAGSRVSTVNYSVYHHNYIGKSCQLTAALKTRVSDSHSEQMR
jgi:hypothetical protein